MKLLLINPKFDESFWSFKWAGKTILRDEKVSNPPLGLATIAALTPHTWDIEIIDENIEDVPLKPQVDLIGICGMSVQFKRQKELLEYYKSKGYYVVVGGSFASLCPEVYKSIADTIISGEGEYIWKDFCADFEKGEPKSLYAANRTVDIKDSPIPRYDLLKLNRYRSISMQFSRGCPFDCEFCDIIVMFGRKPRTKSINQIKSELDLLRKLNVNNVFFVDDNLIGNKKAAIELFDFLSTYNSQLENKFHFGTEVSLNVAYDDELLSLMVKAGFQWVFIGIETPNEESLKETGKLQNTTHNIVFSIRKIYSYGIDVLGGFIIGFDHDKTDIFQKQFNLILNTGIQTAMIGLLVAPPKTRLYNRLLKENRIIEKNMEIENTKLATNIVPKSMSFDEMINGYRKLYKRLYTNKIISQKINNKIKFMKKPLFEYYENKSKGLKVLWNLIFFGILPGGPSRVYFFIKSIITNKPSFLPTIIQDWIIGLSIKNYAKINLLKNSANNEYILFDYIEKMRKKLNNYISKGTVNIAIDQIKNEPRRILISLFGSTNNRFCKKIHRTMTPILKKTTASIYFYIDNKNLSQNQTLCHFLNHVNNDRIRVIKDGL